MESKEKEQINARKKNMRIYSVHRMLTFDLLFYYAIKFLFLTQVKNPYVFKVNGKLIRMVFSENGSTVDECLTRVLESLYR